MNGSHLPPGWSEQPADENPRANVSSAMTPQSLPKHRNPLAVSFVVVFVVLLLVGVGGFWGYTHFFGGDAGKGDTSKPAVANTESPADTAPTEPTPELAPVWQSAYEKVMSGDNERNIVYSDGDNGIVLPEGSDDEWPQNYYESESYKVSLVDFDGGGVPSLVIHIIGWEWGGLDIYTYCEGNIVYSALHEIDCLFKEEASGYYIGIGSYDIYWSRAYKFENGQFVLVENYTEVTEGLETEWEIRIGSATYPLNNSLWEQGEFVLFNGSESPDFETALSAYLNGGTPPAAASTPDWGNLLT